MPETQNIKGALMMLEEILQQKKSAGLATVAVTPERMQELQSLPFDLMRSGSSPVLEAAAPSTATSNRVAAVEPEAAPAAEKPAVVPKQPEPQQDAPNRQEIPQVTAQPVSASTNNYGELAVKVERRDNVEIIFPAGEGVRDRLNNLFRIVKSDQGLKNVATLRDQLVFATGNPESDLMFVGEAPGEEEENQKKPFVGPAGQKLDGIIKAMGLDRKSVYISNIVKYRPKIGDGRFQGSKNRKPTPEEMAISVKYVRSEIEIIQPKVIVALGGTAAEGLLEIAGSVGAMRNQSHQLESIPVVVSYHPSYLCRLESDPDKQRTLQEKRKVWEDMLRAMELLGMPISEAQRGFFTK